MGSPRIRGKKRNKSRAQKREATSPALRALTTSALALGGIAGHASADAPDDRTKASYSYSFYAEDDLSSSSGLPGGETERYEVEMHQLSLKAPWSERIDLGLDVTHETMSGASPWYVVPGAGGEPVQVMSGASIKDERTDLLASGSYYLSNGRIGVATGYSTEKDYAAWNLSFDGERHFNEKNTTLSAGIGMSFDTIEPTDAALFATRPNDEDKKSVSLFGGVSQLIDRASSVQSSLTYKRSSGYLDDPYKQTYVGGLVLADRRPSARNQWAWLTRYRRHFEGLDASLHADYRLYADDWDMVSHTIELAWHQALWERFRLVPSFRWYSQSAADFYAPTFLAVPSDGHHSSDYRLAAFGALGFGLRLETDFRTPWTGERDWYATLSWDRYVADEDWSHVEVNDDVPGLVSFHLLSVGLGVRF